MAEIDNPATTNNDPAPAADSAAGGTSNTAASPVTDAAANPANPVTPAATLNPSAVNDPAPAADPKTGTWPENWQDNLSGGDKKKLEQIKRYSTPQALADALLEAKNKLRTGGYKEPLPDKATAEQLNQWRKDNGIPERAEDYKVELSDGYIIGEDEKPQVDKYIKMMHDENTPPDIVNKNLNAYFKIKEDREAQVYQQNNDAKNSTVEMLRQEWGPKYTGNINTVVSFIKTKFGDSADKILHGFGTDHVALMNDPKILGALFQLATEIDPASTITNANNPGTLKSVEEEISSIERRMSGDRDAYFKDNAAQERYASLITAREKMRGKAA